MKQRQQISFDDFIVKHGLANGQDHRKHPSAIRNIHAGRNHEPTKIRQYFEKQPDGRDKACAEVVPNNFSPSDTPKKYLGYNSLHCWNFPDPDKRKMTRLINKRVKAGAPASFQCTGEPRKRL